jgi:SAM-dependent methyltransferase
MKIARKDGSFSGFNDQNSVFNQVLHELRSVELNLISEKPETLISVGASNADYFRWVSSTLGTPKKHIGLEAYRDQPVDLPPEAVWIRNTASDMRDVQDACADMVFAGQTVEHLWAGELSGFLLESHRVLKPGGLLVVDSPNRTITSSIRWNHPEHTIEQTPKEARDLLDLAGFTVDTTIGHWLVRNEQEMLPLTEIEPASIAKRIVLARERPDDAFSWWIVARKAKAANAVLVKDYVDSLFSKGWAERTMRTVHTASQDFLSEDQAWANSKDGWAGPLVFGPNMPIPPGKWLIGIDVNPWSADTSPGYIDLYSNETAQSFRRHDLPASGDARDARFELDLEETYFGVEVRLFTNGRTGMSARLGASLVPLDGTARSHLPI